MISVMAVAAGTDTRDSVGARLRATIEHLERLNREPCSPGEREAAEWIAARLREEGCTVRIEDERVHGSFHWVLLWLSALAGAGGLAALAGRRAAGFAAGALSAAAMWEDLSGGRRRWFRRTLLPQGVTTNVVAECGDDDGSQTLVVLAHHDAAHTSFLFDQTAPRLLAEKLPGLHRRLDRWPPLMWLMVASPLAVAAGALRRSRRTTLTGTSLAAGGIAVMADLARNPVVPGANDNLTAVAALLELARSLREAPVPGVRVLLVSAGAEEANQEGAIAFAQRHFSELARERTAFLCLDTIGSPELTLIEGEGFLVMRDYPARFKEEVAAAAATAGVHLRRGLRLSFATDGLIPMRAGYRTASVGSVNAWSVPSNYHWPTDTADNVDYGTVEDAVRMTRALIERLQGAA